MSATASSPLGPPGSNTASGASWTPVSLRRSRSGVDLPPACSSRSRSAVRKYSVPTMRASASWSAPDRADGAAAPARGRVRAAPSPLGPQPASATTGRHQKVAWPRRDLPTRPISSVEGVPRGESRVTVLHMLSMSNDRADTGGRILRAAASCVVDYGVDRVTLAEIARRAGVSRPTVYRRWPDTRSIMASMLTSHIADVLREVPRRGRPGSVGKADCRGGRPVAG